MGIIYIVTELVVVSDGKMWGLIQLEPALSAGQGSCISTREKMEDTIDMGSVTYVPYFQIKIEIFFNPINFERESRAIRKMVDNCIDSGKIYVWYKQLHTRRLKKTKVRIKNPESDIYAFSAETASIKIVYLYYVDLQEKESG